MESLNKNAWLDVPFSDFVDAFYETEEAAKTAREHLKDKIVGPDNFVANFLELHQKSSESGLYAEFSRMVNKVLDHAAVDAPEGRGFGKLRYLMTENTHVTNGGTFRKPDALIIEDDDEVEPGSGLSTETSVASSSAEQAAAPPNHSTSPSNPQSHSSPPVYAPLSSVAIEMDTLWSRSVVAFDLKRRRPSRARRSAATGSWSQSLSMSGAGLSVSAVDGETSFRGSKRKDTTESDAEDEVGTQPKRQKTATPTTAATKNSSTASSSKAPPASTRRCLTQDDVQVLGYMTELTHACANRTHVFGCVLRGARLHILFADPHGVVSSDYASLTDIENAVNFAALLYGMARCSAATLGLEQRFRLAATPTTSLPSPSLPLSLKGLRYRVSDDIEVEVLDTIYKEYSLCGRLTRVFLVMHHGKEAVLKTSYPYATRTTEVEMLAQAKQVLIRKMEHARGIPDVYLGVQAEHITEGFRGRLRSRKGLSVDRAANRQLQIVLMERLYPLHTLPTPLYIFGLEHILRVSARSLPVVLTWFLSASVVLATESIFHRDISSANAMLRITLDDDGKPKFFEGVLADFDLAVDHNTIRPDSRRQHWTGTVPFLAYHLHMATESYAHILRFDLESIFYLLIYDTCLWPHGVAVGEEGEEDPNGLKALHQWKNSESAALAKFGLGPFLRKHWLPLNEYLRAASPAMSRLWARIHVLLDHPDVEPGLPGWKSGQGQFTWKHVHAMIQDLKEDLGKARIELNYDLVPREWENVDLPDDV